LFVREFIRERSGVVRAVLKNGTQLDVSGRRRAAVLRMFHARADETAAVTAS
jgi:hypothetical protein